MKTMGTGDDVGRGWCSSGNWCAESDGWYRGVKAGLSQGDQEGTHKLNPKHSSQRKKLKISKSILLIIYRI
jgi:hypothetical protein